MAARVAEIADAVTTALAALAGGDATVTRDWQWSPDLVADLTSRKVYVFPAGYGQADTASRGEDRNEYRVTVVVLERYTGDAARAPAAWVDGLADWVQDVVYGPLGENRTAEQAAALAGLTCETAAVVEVADPEALREHKLFWSEVEFAFREDA